MSEEQRRYDTQETYAAWVRDAVDERRRAVASALQKAFGKRAANVQDYAIDTARFTAEQLAQLIREQPEVLKSLAIAAGVATRAIERDLDIPGLDLYDPRITDQDLTRLAVYLKSFLDGRNVTLSALVELDRAEYTDKEIRKLKGRWEKVIVDRLNAHEGAHYKKRKFRADEEEFELDAACPDTGPIRVGIDLKRIEARRDIHKRCDEIVNKARKFRLAFPASKFIAVVYYPFGSEHDHIRRRLASPEIDAVLFCGASVEDIEETASTIRRDFG